jgi:hypothetical protein
MNALIHTTSKIRVTSVTRVTMLAKHPDSLALKLVTRLHGCSYTRCNSAQTCNAKTSPRPAAGYSLPRADSELSLVRSQNIGRGIEGTHDVETLTNG